MKPKFTHGPYSIAPRTAQYSVADPIKFVKCTAFGIPTVFTALAIENKDQNKSLAIIPLDDSSAENAQLFSASWDMYAAIVKVLKALDPKEVDGMPDLGEAIVDLVLAKQKAEGAI